ncbi:MAG TPA: TolC family protein [Puia sp.]|jgi:outer membrane protein|nr:TolC family protein [Puia sp.]
MRTTKILTLFLSALLSVLNLTAQDKWDLRRCVDYALANNISIKQADIDSRTAKLTFDQAKWTQFGSASAATGLGLNFGRSINQTTNIYTNTEGLSQVYTLQVGITLFNWFALRRATESNNFSYQAQVVNIDKIKNDVTLNVAAGYLSALLAKEQVTLAKTKLELTSHQLENTRRLVDAGSVPELNAAELEVQFATDTASVITAQETYDIDNLQLKAILNLDAASPFDLDTPPIETIPVEPIASLQPDVVYAIAVGTFPQQKMNDLRITSAQKYVDYSRGRLYPTLSAYGALGDNFFNDLRHVDYQTSSALLPGSFALNSNPVPSEQYPIYFPNVTPIYTSQPFYKAFQGYGNQLSNNFGQQVGLQLSIPIFNGNSSRVNYKKAQLNVATAKLTKENDLLTLKQGVYQAYYNAVASLQKFEANQKAVTVAENSFDLASKRYNIGMLNTIDYLTNQNNLFTARINVLIAQYDYVFRMKVLEYYKGLGIKL